MKKLLSALALVLALSVPAFAAPPFARMLGANFVFRAQSDVGSTLCSATLFTKVERWVLTNYHCIEDSVQIVERDVVAPDGTVKKVRVVTYGEITLSQSAYSPDGKVGELTLRARILSFSRQTDLAVLQILSETTELPFVAQLPPDSYTLRQGQTVYGVGNPLGLENSLSKGILAHLYREHRWDADQTAKYIQTDATQTGGSSGGALYDDDGMLIGVPSAGYRGVSINFAIPITEVKKFLRANGFASAWDVSAPSRDEWIKESERKAKEEQNKRF